MSLPNANANDGDQQHDASAGDRLALGKPAAAAAADEPVDLLRDRKVTLNDIMHWSIKYSDAEVLHELHERGRAAPVHEPIDPKWVDAMFPLDSDKAREALRVLGDPAAPLADAETALDLLLFLCDTIDNAADLPRMGGFDVLAAVVRAPAAPQLRSGALWVLATALANNPPAIDAALAHPALLDLVLVHAEQGAAPAVSDASGDGDGDGNGDAAHQVETQLKALGVLSALCMTSARAVALDARVGLFAALVRAVRPRQCHSAPQRRLAFVLTKLAAMDPAIARALAAAGACEAMTRVRAAAAEGSHDEVVEQVGSFFGALAEAGVVVTAAE